MTYNLARGVGEHARRHPDATALVVGENAHTYASLASSAARAAGALRPFLSRSHAGREPKVAVLASRSIEAYVGLLGALWAGAAYVPINPKAPPERVRQILAASGACAVVVDDRGRTALPSDYASIAVDRAALSSGSHAGTPADVARDALGYVMFTSGTTGAPKGVEIEAGSVAHFLDVMRALYDVTPADRVPQYSEISFDFSVLDLFIAWDGGASLHVVPEEQMMAPANFIKSHALTTWGSVPSVIAFLSRMKLLQPNAFPSLRFSFFCGEALPAASARAWQAAASNSVVDNHYGPTEATVACTYRRFTGAADDADERGVVGIGRAYDGMHVALVDDDLRVLHGPDATGQIAIHGPQVARGYSGNDALTHTRFVELDDATLGKRARFYLTGDRGKRAVDGGLHHLGRIDQQVKVLGHRIELEEIDAHLRAVSHSDACAAIAWPLQNGIAQGIVGFVAGTTRTPAELVAALRTRVPPYMVPARVLVVDDIPLSANGKIDRDRLARSLA